MCMDFTLHIHLYRSQAFDLQRSSSLSTSFTVAGRQAARHAYMHWKQLQLRTSSAWTTEAYFIRKYYYYWSNSIQAACFHQIVMYSCVPAAGWSVDAASQSQAWKSSVFWCCFSFFNCFLNPAHPPNQASTLIWITLWLINNNIYLRCAIPLQLQLVWK
jgi:hypothetical protein